MKQETTATLRYVRMSPRKARLLIDLVRGLGVGEAIEQLQFSSKGVARPLVKLLRSAVANAEHNHEMNRETLVIKSANVDGGPMQYRWTPRAHGRASPIRKRTAHVTIVLEGEIDEKSAKGGSASGGKNKKEEPKVEAEKKEEKS